MQHVSETRRGLLLLVGLALLSFAPVMCQRWLAGSGVYNIRIAGGLHPSDLLMLRWIGGLALSVPIAVFTALVVCIFRPTWIRPILTGSVAIFLLYVIAFLFQAVLVITFNVRT